MKLRFIVAAAVTALVCFGAGPESSAAADDYDDFLKGSADEFDAFLNKSEKEFADFLEQANKDMADFLGKPWDAIVSIPKKQPEPDPEPAPVILDDDAIKRSRPKPRPVVIDTVVAPPVPEPRPVPVSPIKEVPVTNPLPDVNCVMYGTPFAVRGVDLGGFSVRNRDYQRAWKQLMNAKVNNFVIDCLALREKHNLCDWAFMKLVGRLSSRLVSGRANDTAMLTGYLLSQCGYKMRFCEDEAGALHVLYASDGIVYNTYALYLDGSTFYALTEPSSKQVMVCNFSFPKERKISMAINGRMKLDYAPAPSRTVTARFCPSLTATVTPNKNLIDFYNEYPEATLNESPYTKWAIYANVPVSAELKRDLYPAVRTAIAGKSQGDAANILLHLAQTFPYGYDNEIWGRDRAFFPDETWHYPYSDCEDHAIHFSRLVRDLMGLDVVLVYYPGHLASAVAFTDSSITGDYIMHNGRRFTVCDPTIFYSNIGETMRDMDNSSAILIDLVR